MEEKVELLKKAIIDELPQIPFIIDQVGEAVDWCAEAHDSGIVVRLLESALDVAKYVKSISEPNFYRTHLLIASLIGDIPNVMEDARFEKFKTASKALDRAIKNIVIDPNLTEERGCFNAISIHLTQLARIDEECLTVMLYGILHDLEDIVSGLREAKEKSPITPQDYITVIGYAYVMSNLRMAQLKVLENTKAVINKIEILLNNDVIY